MSPDDTYNLLGCCAIDLNDLVVLSRLSLTFVNPKLSHEKRNDVVLQDQEVLRVAFGEVQGGAGGDSCSENSAQTRP